MDEDAGMREKKRSFVEWVERFEAKRDAWELERRMELWRRVAAEDQAQEASWEAMRARWKDEADR